jgi:hypothetical protein
MYFVVGTDQNNVLDMFTAGLAVDTRDLLDAIHHLRNTLHLTNSGHRALQALTKFVITTQQIEPEDLDDDEDDLDY